MKRWRSAIIFASLVALVVLAGPREEGWKKVDEAMKKGLPKTAVEELETIIKGALKEKAYGEALKAICRKIVLEANIQGNKPEEKITRLQAEIARAPEEIKPLMEAILANWFWHYFQQNRWRFLQRTQTAVPPGKDFTAWDLATILKEISRHFDLALAAEKKLKETPVSAYRDFLVEGVAPDNYRPTLFDIIAYSALEFYTSGEQAGAKAEDAFELSAESPVLSEAKEFLRWQPVTSDTDSSIYRAVLLYQKLLAFHQNDTDKTAFLDADLHRLNFGYNQAFGEEKKSRYQAALKKFIEQWADHEVSAMARFHLASLLKEDNELVQAHELARQGYQAFPESAGGRWCYNLMKQIEARSVSIQTERVWNEPWPSISVTYRNINKVFFRVIPADFQGRLKLDTWQPEGLTDKEFKEIRNQKPLQEWSASLPATSDYRERTEQVPVPQSLPPGFYFILASHQPTFTDQDNQVSVAAVWVSRLALVVRSGARESGVEGFVLTAREGEPLAGASVQVWQRDYQDRFWKQLDTVKTDRNGFFQYRDSKLSRQYLLLAFYKDDCLASAPNYVYRGGKVASSFSRTVLFTDRALYRPGQIISYKGICFQVDQEKNNYRVLSENTLTVVFRDVNGKEISRQEKKTNQYGSFSGSFVAPSDRLTGRMTIQVEVGPSGSVAINVEEYKRPKFQVTLELPEKPVRLDEKVTLRGKAVAYTGAPIGAAKVKYRVVREVCWPVWYRWYYWWPREPVQSQEIAHGLTTTDSDGSFTLTFLARPDRSVSQKQQAYFTFRVNADVTDITGETRSGQRMINLGYASLQARMTAEEWQTVEKPAEITINTATLDGQSQPATGVVKIYLLKQPEKVVRSELVGTRWSYYRKAADFSAADPSDPNCWKEEEVVQEIPFTTDGTGSTKISAKLPAGIYRAILETKDSFGTPVSCFLPLQVLDLKASKYQVRRPHVFIASRWSVEVGQTFLALWGTGYPSGQAYIEIEHRGKILQAYWTSPEKTQAVIEQAVTEEMRGGFSVRVTYVRENRAYLESRTVDVPWSNQNLSVKWERFVSKLEPGAREKWSAVITGPEAEKVVAEMVAALYDASLDAYLPHDWVTSFSQYFYKERSTIQSRFENSMVAFHHLFGYWPVDYKPAGWNYRRFPDEVVSNLRGYGFLRQAAGANAKGMEMAPLAAMAMEGSDRAMVEKSAARADALQEERKKVGEAEPSAPATVDLSKVNPRKNLNETAFFFPHLVSDENGVVRMEFTMPEAMTEWKFLSFAHDRKLRSGFLTDRVVTAKELMVEPNPPRFLREGDLIEFVVKISNQSPTRQTGKVRLNLQEARTLKNVDQSLGNTRPEQTFDLPAGESGRYSWRLTVPEGTDFLIYQAVASTGRLSDGEEGYLPVIPQKVLVTESLPLPIRGPATRKFFFKSLLESAKSSTLRHQSLTVQMASNPAWYAVMALPYLMEYPYECVEQSFNRLYANALARTIVQSDPKIKRVFEQWKGTDALDSPLEKNQELKGVMLEETPWLRQAQAESQARRNIAVLFDENRLNEETERLLRKISELQLGDGAWSWFPGGYPNDYITLYITTGFGRLRHLGVDLDVKPALKALQRLDNWVNELYLKIVKAGNKEQNNLTPTVALYLYGRSFFLKDKPVAAAHKEAVDYFLTQARKYWLELSWRQSQAHLAVALKRFGDKETATAIMKSIKERAVTNEELGMFWRETELSWWWYRAPIETQAMMIEAFDEVTGDAKAVEDCKVWLLKQKQTQDWKTTKATADAVYALLLRGRNLLACDALVEVSLGAEKIKPTRVEAGTGFYQERFLRNEIRPAMATVTVKKSDPGVAWGGVHWQYLEDIGKVKPYEGTPLKLKKALFVKEYTSRGPVLKPVRGALSVGDELVVRIELRVDRDMEYVHLKDQRGSGTEPVNVLSRYRYQDGLAYYEATRDTASHFFIDYLPKGTYVFEYSVRVQLPGEYQTGMASIQCLYAPEFNSHSESFRLVVK